ncbi:MAG: hypothetical protein ACK4N5_05315 [Myxococcales bacterium]
MFAMLRFLFYTFVAVVVGVFIGTVPVGGRTIAERISAAFDTSQAMLQAQSAQRTDKPEKPAAKKGGEPQRAARVPPPSKPGAQAPSPSPAAPQGPVTAGAANTPDARSEADREDLAKIIAAKSVKK